MPNGVLHRRVLAQAENVDVHGSAFQPFPQALEQRLAVTFPEFGDNLRNTTWREVLRQAGDDAFQDVLTGGASVAKSEGIERRGHKGRICRDQVEALPANGFEEIANHNV